MFKLPLMSLDFPISTQANVVVSQTPTIGLLLAKPLLLIIDKACE